MFTALRRRRTGIKRALLDQTVISGVGNIYADEALWRVRMHYARRAETGTRAEAPRLLNALQEVMAAALEAGGTSFDALYVNVNGASGYFDRSLQAYGQAVRECSRCEVAGRSAGVIQRAKFMGRSSYWCPVCQPRPRNGPMAGASAALRPPPTRRHVSLFRNLTPEHSALAASVRLIV